MSSKTHIRFITAMGFCYGVAEVMQRHYQKTDGRRKIKDIVKQLSYKSERYVEKFNKKLRRSEIKSIERKIQTLVDDGIEQAESYQEYISMVCLMLSDLHVKMTNERYGGAKLNAINDMLNIFGALDRHYAGRIRHDRFNLRGSEQYEKFLAVF